MTDSLTPSSTGLHASSATASSFIPEYPKHHLMYKIVILVFIVLLSNASTYSQCNNVNLAESRPTTAAFGSATSDLLEPWRAFDGGEYAGQTRWQAPDNANSHYVGIDLGQAYNICSVYIEWGSLDFATDFKIQGSNDNSSWTDLIHVTGNTQNALTITNLPLTGNYRYIKALFITKVYDWSAYTVWNFQIFNRVVNDPPSVNLTAPANGTSYLQGANIDMAATAADANGSISKVEFYQGTTKIGEDATAPYSIAWTGAAIGSYALYAKAIDNGGASSWTDSIHITVTNPPASLRNWTVTGNNIANTNTGFVSIGAFPTTLPGDTAIKLAVKGTIYARKLTVTETLWADYVFKPGYCLRPLQQVEHFIALHQHLPELPSVKEVEANGINVGDNQALLLSKIEELTLYIITIDKQLRQQQRQIKNLQKGRLKANTKVPGTRTK
jgi:hypothetical protein